MVKIVFAFTILFVSLLGTNADASFLNRKNSDINIHSSALSRIDSCYKYQKNFKNISNHLKKIL